MLVGPRAQAAAVARDHAVIQARHSGPQATLLVHANGHAALASPSWTVHNVELEELVLAYLGQQVKDTLTPAPRSGEEVRS
jgi:ABC-2 type transport system ATP-binding protein